MRIEFEYTLDNAARMTIDDEALKMILNYIVYDIRDLPEAEIVEMAKCVGEIAQAIAKLDQAPAEIPVRPNESLAFIPYPEGDPAFAGKTLGKLWNEMDQGKNTIYLELRRAGDNETKSHIAKIDAYVAATRGGKA